MEAMNISRYMFMENANFKSKEELIETMKISREWLMEVMKMNKGGLIETR
jgi:hypothetical protein